MQYGIHIRGILAAALSLKMLVALSTGLCLWVVYGAVKDDWVIILANSIGATLSLAVLAFKIRDLNS